MNAFFPVASTVAGATTSSGSTAVALPGTGPMIRIARQTSADDVYIAFGTASVVATAASMMLISGVVEELEIPNSAIYTNFAVVSGSGTVFVNVCTGPRYKVG